jgi:cell shape-determining protein MreC
MSRRTRNQVFVIILLLVIGCGRLLLQFDPIYNFLQSITLPIADKIGESALITSETTEVINALEQYKEVDLQDLRTQLALDDTKFESLNSEVIKRDIGGFRKTIWVNKGANDGVKLNQAVSSAGFLIGRISRLNDNFSEVILINDPNFRVSVTANGLSGLVTNKSASLQFDLVPGIVDKGALVLTDGIDGTFMPSIPVGIVGNDISDSTSVFKSYTLTLPFNPIDVKYAQIIKGS